MNHLTRRPLASATGVAACALTLALSACNSGSSDSSPTSSSDNSSPQVSTGTNAIGVFLDAPVQGLRVEHANGTSTTTGALGEFQYNTGESVTFYLGKAGVKSCNPANSLTRNRSPLIRRIHTHKACPALQAASTLPYSLVCRPIPEPLAG